MSEIDSFMQATYDTYLNAGLDIVPLDTAARVMAILLLYGNNEGFTLSPKFRCECRYIQKKWGISGGERPDPDFAHELQHYINVLEDYAKGNPKEVVPQWAKDLIQKRYGIKLLY